MDIQTRTFEIEGNFNIKNSKNGYTYTQLIVYNILL